MPLPTDYAETASTNLDPRRVEALWTYAASSDGEHLVLPDGRMDVIAMFDRDQGDGVAGLSLMIVGPSQRYTRVLVRRSQRYIGVRFRAGWGGVCLGVEPALLRDGVLHGSDAMAALGGDAEAIMQAGTEAELIDAVRRFAADRARLAGQMDGPTARAIDLLHMAGGRMNMAELVRLVGASERHLRRRLLASVGLSFKAFSSVLRFQRTMRLLSDNGASIGLAETAIEGGYSDQAHMTREFRLHGGFTPGTRPAVVLVGLDLAH